VPTYQWAGLELAADFALPELVRPDPSRAVAGPSASDRHWRIRRWRGGAPMRTAIRWFHHWTFPNGRRWLSFARLDDGYLLRFPRFADFVVRLPAREVVARRGRSTPPDTVRHLLLDQVLPLIVASGDCLALHASVLNVDGGAIAFLGAAGHGKSTLAAALGRRGHAVLSDDCCVVRRSARGFDVWSTYPGVRLFGPSRDHVFGDAPTRGRRVSHYSSKRRVIDDAGTPRFGATPVPLRRVYVLADRTTESRVTRVEITRRSRRDSVVDLVGGTFFLDVTDPERALDAFGLAGDIAASLPVCSLTFPWDLAALDEVIDQLLADLSR
jgi:hypothetical protein